MSFFDFSIDNFSDSETISNAISNNIVPKDGINIVATSTAKRGYSGQTLSSSDLISASSGKDLLASGVYGNMHRLSAARENLNSLATSILGSYDDNLSVISDRDFGPDGNPLVIKGQDAALQIIAGTALGKKYNKGMLEGLDDVMRQHYSQAYDGRI